MGETDKLTYYILAVHFRHAEDFRGLAGNGFGAAQSLEAGVVAAGGTADNVGFQGVGIVGFGHAHNHDLRIGLVDDGIE